MLINFSFFNNIVDKLKNISSSNFFPNENFSSETILHPLYLQIEKEFLETFSDLIEKWVNE
jgi:hypothetical protein